MARGVLLDRHSGRPVVDRDLRDLLEARERGDVAELLERSRLAPHLRAAEITPPLFMDVSNAYSGDELGLPYRDLIGEGIVGATDLAVTAHAAANSVDVAKGSAWVLGDTNTDRQPNYRVFNDAIVNLGISPDATNPRRVHVIAQVTDQGFAGTGRTWALQALHGTPAASPTLPALPASALSLANVLVPAAAASSAAYTITDLRTRATVGAGQALGGGGMTLIDDYTVVGSVLATYDTNTRLSGNIPQTYKHLRVIVTHRCDAAGTANLNLRFNNDSTGSYYWMGSFDNNTAVAIDQSTAQTSGRLAYVPGSGVTAGVWGLAVIDIPDYTSATSRRMWEAHGWSPGDRTAPSMIKTDLSGIHDVAAAPTTRLQLFLPSGNLVIGSRITLWGEN